MQKHYYAFIVTKLKWIHDLRNDFFIEPGNRFVSGPHAPTTFKGYLRGIDDVRVGDAVTFSTEKSLDDLIEDEHGTPSLRVPRFTRARPAFKRGQEIILPSGDYGQYRIGVRDIRDVVAESFDAFGHHFISHVVLSQVNYRTISESTAKVEASVRSVVRSRQPGRYLIFAEPASNRYQLTGDEIYLAYVPFSGDRFTTHRKGIPGDRLDQNTLSMFYPGLRDLDTLLLMDIKGLNGNHPGAGAFTLDGCRMEQIMQEPGSATVKKVLNAYLELCMSEKSPAVVIHNFSPYGWTLPRSLGFQTIDMPSGRKYR